MTQVVPELTICIATRDRAASLRAMLRSLEAALAGGRACEVIVVDNGSHDETSQVLATWAVSEARRALSVPVAGKARALNAALECARGSLVAFTDDDVEIDRDWPAAIVRFFAEHPDYAAAMGRVRIPPTAAADAAIVELIDEYRTIPVFDLGEVVCDVHDLYGANMAVRRAALAQVGGFNPRLGPGVGTAGEDTDLARRLMRAGLRLGYMPQSIVYHEVDRSRLTPEYLVDFQIRLGRSELVLHPERTYWHALPRLLAATLSYVWATLTGARRRRTRAWGRMVRHRDLLHARWRGVRPDAVADMAR